MSDERSYRGLNPPHVDVPADEAAMFAADAAARRVARQANYDGSITLDHDSAVRVAAALLFYLRSWEADPDDPEETIPSRALTRDAGQRAADLLDDQIFPSEIKGAAEEFWQGDD